MFGAKITKIASWNHDDLAHNTVLGVQTFMTYLGFALVPLVLLQL
jgi:hypothetical protein